jgi:hypothetical protein
VRGYSSRGGGGLSKMVVYGSGIPAAAYPAEAATSATKAGRYGVFALFNNASATIANPLHLRVKRQYP